MSCLPVGVFWRPRVVRGSLLPCWRAWPVPSSWLASPALGGDPLPHSRHKFPLYRNPPPTHSPPVPPKGQLIASTGEFLLSHNTIPPLSQRCQFHWPPPLAAPSPSAELYSPIRISMPARHTAFPPAAPNAKFQDQPQRGFLTC